MFKQQESANTNGDFKIQDVEWKIVKQSCIFVGDPSNTFFFLLQNKIFLSFTFSSLSANTSHKL